MEHMRKNLQIIKDTVRAMGGTIEEFLPERGCFYVNVMGKRILLERDISITRQSFVSRQLTRCKDITHKLLVAHGLPTPQTRYFYNKSYNRLTAAKQLRSLRYPIIIKDATGSNSRGIFPFVKDVGEAMVIIAKELPNYRSMIAQTMVFGREYRILVLGERVIAALEMVPPYVRGDGSSSVRELIRKKQKTTAQRTAFDKKLSQILNDQGVALNDILPVCRVIYFKKSCLAESGETRDVTGFVHKEVGKICVAASKIVGKQLTGIDVICRDITQSPTAKSFNILEINGKPDLYMHHHPDYGKSQNVVKKVIEFMAAVAN